ncbi:hypothetical protein [Brevundimonas sp.]|uniref:hypothetical protein n=1 Tax=Brevundimonas sp. TaxID=1871086 RepID=UPI002D39B78E|nr:hypothetical protein [Brevundimonas sp.]HYD26490.1 hypothetical protein [Brevundimonas sp.]
MIVGTVTAIPLVTRVTAKPDSVGGDVQDWIHADDLLESLTLEWSRAEADLIATAVAPASFTPTSQMQRLERQIARIDQKRSVLLDRIVRTPAGSPEEAVGKLLVAKRLLEGEGGVEHDLVADAVTRLATVHGLVD